jgi:uncharacterized protein (TIGR02996 family)
MRFRASVYRGAMAKADPAGLLDAYWARPGDRELLAVYADALEQAGEPRGQLIQLSLAGKQAERDALIKKAKGELVGPARAYLREYAFGTDGLVATARAEADKVIAGIAEIGRLNPHLILTLTSVNTIAIAKQLAGISLERIFFVDFTSITGTHGGTQLPDKVLGVIGPAFAGVRCLALSCRGRPEQCFSPAGLASFGRQLAKLEYLQFDYYSNGLPPAADYAKAIADSFPALRVVHSFDLDARAFGSRVKLVVTEPAPATADAVLELLR